jgi:NADPH:quinone reductase-like Zn-dependent oxidoreductase
MPHAIQIRQAGGPEVLNWTAIKVGEPGPGQVRLRQAAGLNCIDVYLSQKGSLFLTRPLLFHYIARREELEASANELFNVVASGKVRINVNQRFALKDAADAHKALEARATSGSTVLTI